MGASDSLDINIKKSNFLKSWMIPDQRSFEPSPTAQVAQNKSFNQAYKFQPQELVTPGWGGESLNSKEALRIKKIIQELWVDAEKKLSSIKELNPSLKQSLFNNFISFAHINNLSAIDLNGPQQFWSHFISHESPYRKDINNFIKVHSFRSVALYIYKIRFLAQMISELKQELKENIVLAPNALFSYYFPKGSHLEISCSSFKINEYSWYNPSAELSKKIFKDLSNLQKISLQEIMKLCTYRPSNQLLDKRQMYCETEFSHSISHKSFGSFLKLILGRLPYWIDPDKKEQLNTFYKDISHNTKHCKFIGDYLSSFSQSHWLGEKAALNTNLNFKDIEEDIIFPEFEGQSFNEGEFTKLIQEIQFLTFLVDKFQHLKKHKENGPSHLKIEKGLIQFLASVFTLKTNQKNSDSDGQVSLFPCLNQNFKFDYTILNISKLPKNNQHHHLLGQVISQANTLKENGFLFLFTTQQFFVPSKSEKTDQLLKKFKIEAIFNFDELKGKGEISPFLYILRKRKEKFDPQDLINLVDGQFKNKESCLSFKWTGVLHSFSLFNQVVSQLENFFNLKNPLTPLYQSESPCNINFSFHQDAIIDGKLLQSSTKTNRVTHPLFFKNLTKNCYSFDYFFSFESIDPGQDHNKYCRDNFIAVISKNLKIEELYTYVLVVGHEDIQQIYLEIIPSSSFNAKLNQLGHAYYQYFGLKAKIPHLNINLFREYFRTEIGRQIAEFSLNGGPTKTKGKLKGLMIPSFFASSFKMSNEFIKTHPYLAYSGENILAVHPDELSKNILRLKNFDLLSYQENLSDFIGRLCQFKISIGEAVDRISDASESANFNNPLFIEKLRKVKTISLFPQNPDIFIKFMVAGKLELHLPVNNVVKKSNESSHYLEFLNNDSVLCQIFSDENMLFFIKFLMKFTLNKPLSTILQTMKVPRIQDLLKILNEKNELKSNLSGAKNELEQFISQIIIQQISS